MTTKTKSPKDIDSDPNFVRNPDGSYNHELNLSKKQSNAVYKAALADNTITLSDLAYQAKYNPDMKFKDLVCAAFVVQALYSMVEASDAYIDAFEELRNEVKAKPRRSKKKTKK